MTPKLPLSHGWKHRVHSSVLHFPALDSLDSTIHMPFFKRPVSLAQYISIPRSACYNGPRSARTRVVVIGTTRYLRTDRSRGALADAQSCTSRPVRPTCRCGATHVPTVPSADY